ncbi:MAG: tetratricopeptide repeat protein [Flavobacteriia bacterium]|nr:tetratricopeptide repeat protein [Flavobacteriia bacterium]OJX34828.1 MAG: hypothetical protein BGO87_08760 [Flavobacteriia bacterium 40-80]
MKTHALIIIFCLAHSIIFGQQRVEAEKYVAEGIAHHDKGDYEGAITRYDKALELDKDNFLALSEKAMTLTALGRFNEAIICCKKVIEKYPDDKELSAVYVTYGNAADGLKKPEKALEIYNEGIKIFPDKYQLHFNKGITLVGLQEYDEALLCFEKAIRLNPSHPGSHNAIGHILNYKKKRIASILVYGRFLMAEPESSRAKINLDILTGLVKGNVTQKNNSKSITIRLNPGLLGDTTEDGKNRENNFSVTELLLDMTSALDFDKKYKKETEIERFIRKFELICSSLAETKDKNSGFYWEYYAPYFIEMKEKNFISAFAHVAFISSGDKAITKWIKEHRQELYDFIQWSDQFEWYGADK